MTAAGIVLIVAGALAIIGGLLLFGVATIGGAIAILFAVIYLAIGAASIWAGVQVLALRERGRALGVILAGIGVLLALVSLIGFQNFFDILTLLAYGFVIWALVTNRQYFHA